MALRSWLRNRGAERELGACTPAKQVEELAVGALFDVKSQCWPPGPAPGCCSCDHRVRPCFGGAAEGGAHVVIDGAFDSPGTHPFGKHIALMDPDELAGVYVGLHEQPKSVWSFEIQVGPSAGDMGMRL